MYMDEKRREELETLFMIGGMAVMGAIGILAFICGIMGIDIDDMGVGTTTGMLFGLTGFLFAIIILVTSSSHRK